MVLLSTAQNHSETGKQTYKQIIKKEIQGEQESCHTKVQDKSCGPSEGYNDHSSVAPRTYLVGHHEGIQAGSHSVCVCVNLSRREKMKKKKKEKSKPHMNKKIDCM